MPLPDDPECFLCRDEGYVLEDWDSDRLPKKQPCDCVLRRRRKQEEEVAHDQQ